MPDARNFFSAAEKDDIKNAIIQAEQNSSGELRVHLENHCAAEVLDRAAFLFEELGMKKTAARNGVLFYLAVKDRKFAVIGDAGINAVVETHFWEEIRQTMTAFFQKGEFVNGLIAGIQTTGQKLKTYFPFQQDDKNELPNDISYGSAE
ncbi:TPM domain-containing protein [Bacteroidales bacterium]